MIELFRHIFWIITILLFVSVLVQMWLPSRHNKSFKPGSTLRMNNVVYVITELTLYHNEIRLTAEEQKQYIERRKRV